MVLRHFFIERIERNLFVSCATLLVIQPSYLSPISIRMIPRRCLSFFSPVVAVEVGHKKGQDVGSSNASNGRRARKLVPAGLYLMGASLAMSKGRRHAYVMMEPRLARTMGMPVVLSIFCKTFHQLPNKAVYC